MTVRGSAALGILIEDLSNEVMIEKKIEIGKGQMDRGGGKQR